MTHTKKDKENNLGVAYFELMKELSSAVHTKVFEYIEKLEGERKCFCHQCDGNLQEEMLHIPKARAGKNIMRSALTALMYRLNGGCGNVNDIIPALAVSELNNVNAYLDNIIFDDKKGVWRNGDARRSISGITIASGIFRELSEKAVLDIQTSNENRIVILSSLCECMAKSYQGQYADLAIGISDIDCFASDEEYFDWYVEKSELQSGFLYGFSAKTGAILAGSGNDLVEKSEKIGRIIGTGLHISSDLGDFACMDGISGSSTGFKYYQDQMADLVNGRLTFPIYHILKYGSSREKRIIMDMIGNNHATKKELLGVSSAIHSSGAFAFGKKFIREYYKQVRRLINNTFVDSNERGMLKAMTSIIVSNKFLSALRNNR